MGIHNQQANKNRIFDASLARVDCKQTIAILDIWCLISNFDLLIGLRVRARACVCVCVRLWLFIGSSVIIVVMRIFVALIEYIVSMMIAIELQLKMVSENNWK